MPLGDFWTCTRMPVKLIAFTEGKSYTEFEANLLLRRGVERSVEIIGEASRKLSKDLKRESSRDCVARN